FGVGLRERHPVGEARKTLQPAVSAVMQAVAAPNYLRGVLGSHPRLQRHWNPKVESESDQRADKPRRRDADDRDLDVIERHAASDDGRAAPEAPLPIAVADYCDGRGVPLIIGP